MSIIERALKKAQQARPAANPSDTGTRAVTDEPVLESGAEPSVEPAVAATESATRPPPVALAAAATSSAPYRAIDPNSLTSRDMKRIVEIDFDKLRAAGRLPQTHAARQTDEEMRRIKWPLLSTLAGRGGGTPARNNVILVTSAEPSEGKSYTSLNLALSIVRDREMRVILVDGDVALPGLTPSMGLEGAPGLNDALDDQHLDVNEIIYRTTIDGMLFVPAGKWHEHSPELMAGSRMPQVINELAARVGNGVVILDSPPLLATNEAQAATRYVGHVLMVVRADRTEQRAVTEALALIDDSTPVSAVLNGVEPTMLSKYYGHYYYGYGQKKGTNGYGGYGRSRNEQK